MTLANPTNSLVTAQEREVGGSVVQVFPCLLSADSCLSIPC